MIVILGAMDSEIESFLSVMDGRQAHHWHGFEHHQGEIEGSGIGLAFTHKLARLMDSQIGVESHPGIGSRFWIDLPCASPIHTAPEPVHAAQAARATLLYIEDDALSQKLLSTILASKRPQYRLFTADAGRAGIALAKEIQPDLILLDLQLPDSSGHAILQALRAQPPLCALVVEPRGGANPWDCTQCACHTAWPAEKLGMSA